MSMSRLAPARLVVPVLGVTTLLLAAACGPDRSLDPALVSVDKPPASVGGCYGGQKPAGSQEGEVYGSIYEQGQRTCQLWPVSLVPYADAQSRLHMASYRSGLTADWKWVNMFEFWDPLAGQACQGPAGTLASYVANGSAVGEYPHAPPLSPNKEGHCVRPGRYRFTVTDDRSFDVEYIQPSGHNATNPNAPLGVESIEVTAYDPALNEWQDLVINTDFTTVHPGDTPILEIQNAGSSPYLASFTNQASPSGTAADWFRFSAARSTSGWTVDGRGAALARLYYDGTNLSQSTAYYDYLPESFGVLRLHRFPNPTTATKVYTVGLELLRPDEQPADMPSVTRTVTITRINPDLAPGTIGAPTSAILGQSMTVTVPERNLGTNPYGPVEAGWQRKLYLSSDQVLSPATDVLVDNAVESSAIPAGQTITASRSFTVPANLGTGTYYVIASLDAGGAVIESNEGNNVGASAAVAVTAAPPVACATFENTTTWRNTDQIFSAACSSTGSNIQYRWRTDSTGAWTAYSSSPTYEFFGHGTAGAHQVTVEVKNTTTGVSATHSYTFTVQSGVVAMTGPTWITVKQQYSYTVSPSSLWYERFQPATAWGPPFGPQTSYTRVWSAGCYVVDLRADASSGGVLKRGRLTVTVAIGSGCGGPA